MRLSRVSVLIGLIVLAVSAGQACNKAPLTAPSGTAITLIATSTVVPVNGSTDVTAILIEGALTAGQGPNASVANAQVSAQLFLRLVTLGVLEHHPSVTF